MGQGIAVSLQTSNGAGRHQDALSASQLDKYYKVVQPVCNTLAERGIDIDSVTIRRTSFLS